MKAKWFPIRLWKTEEENYIMFTTEIMKIMREIVSCEKVVASYKTIDCEDKPLTMGKIM